MNEPVSVFSAAKRLCEKSDWTLTHLEIQKLVYMAHMYYMGNRGSTSEPLIKEQYQAWLYGPVCPPLYRRLKEYGAHCVPEKAFASDPSMTDSHPGADLLDKMLATLPRGDLVAITHWSRGAWSKKWQSDVRGIPLTNEDILAEYQERVRVAREK